MFNSFIAERANNISILVADGKQIGFVDGADISSTEYEQGNICIIPEFQNQGIGSDYLKSLFNAHPHQNISLRVFKQNPAQNLYKRLGFEIVSETKSHFYMMKKA